MNQHEFVAITCSLLKAREKSRVQGASSWRPGPNLKSPRKKQHSLPKPFQPFRPSLRAAYYLFICLSRLRFWQLLSWCGPAIPTHTLTKDSHNTRNFMPYASRIVCGFLTYHTELVNMEGISETGPTVCSHYPRRLESLTICGPYYKGSTFSSVILN